MITAAVDEKPPVHLGDWKRAIILAIREDIALRQLRGMIGRRIAMRQRNRTIHVDRHGMARNRTTLPTATTQWTSRINANT